MVPIMMDRAEFNTDELNELKSAINGTEYKPFESKNTVKDVPQSFKDWIDANAERSLNWKSPPYFVKDNFNGGNIAGGLKSMIPSLPNIPIVKPVITPPEPPIVVVSEYAKNIIEVSKKIGINSGSEMTFEDANELKGNINFDKSVNYKINCQSCVVSNELRRRGLDVTAMPNMQTKGNIPYQLSMKTEMAWIDPSTGLYPIKQIAGRGVRKVSGLTNELSKIMYETGRYHINFVWKGTRSGHIITVDKLPNGHFRFYDPQNGKIVSWANLSIRVSLKYGISVLRVDDLLINTDIIMGIVSDFKNFLQGV